MLSEKVPAQVEKVPGPVEKKQVRSRRERVRSGPGVQSYIIRDNMYIQDVYLLKREIG